MARVTVEDCLARVSNRFALTVLASRRARALGEGRGTPTVECENKEGVTALREIEEGKVRYVEDIATVIAEFIEEQRSQYRSTSGEHTFLEAASFVVGGDDDDEDGASYEADDDNVRELGDEGDRPRRRLAATGEDDANEDDAEEGDPEVPEVVTTDEETDEEAIDDLGDAELPDDDADPDAGEGDAVEP